MGIRGLNRFLTTTCSNNAIRKISLAELSNKTIVVDTSIYLYKFIGENTLIESMISLLSICKYYSIHLVFVFDGKPPPSKKHILDERESKKKKAEDKYRIAEVDGNVSELKVLQKQMVRIKNNHVRIVKDMIVAFGAEFCVAQNEADEVCAKLVIDGHAWACLTDDMDLFMYGCPRILRKLHLVHAEVVLHDLTNIISDLSLDSIHDFQVMVLDSGLADVNTSTDNDGFIKSLEKCRGSKSMIDINKYICIDHVHIPPILGKNIEEDIRAQILFENGIMRIE
jgi:hypothetical protein